MRYVMMNESWLVDEGVKITFDVVTEGIFITIYSAAAATTSFFFLKKATPSTCPV